MKILVLDNYDSFVYNLVHLLYELGYESDTEVFRNDKIPLEAVDKYDKILLSPGPGIPDEAGIMPQLIHRYAPEKSILGICLGHQGIAEAFGATLLNMPKVLHGVGSQATITRTEDPLFADVPTNFRICHYHSWTVVPESTQGDLEITALDNVGNVMGLRHKTYRLRGLQFHPESILTEHGKLLISNWLEKI